jgi:hypothetical protein
MPNSHPPRIALLFQRYAIAVARLQQGRAAEAEADIATALKMSQQENPSSLNTKARGIEIRPLTKRMVRTTITYSAYSGRARYKHRAL